MNAKKFERCRDTLKVLSAKNDAVFLTLTTPDVVDFVSIRERWRSLRHWLCRRLGGAKYVMNYEKHPGYLQKSVKDRYGFERILRSDGVSHGWHIHAVFDTFIPLLEISSVVRQHGFGRVDVRRVTSCGISDYLTKHALKAYRGLSRKEREVYPKLRMRLVNSSRGLPTLDEYAWHGALLDKQRGLLSSYVRDCKVNGDKARVRQWFTRCLVLAHVGAKSWRDWGRVYSAARVNHRMARRTSKSPAGTTGEGVSASFLPS